MVKELCLVAVADAPTGMGGVFKIDKNATTYCVYIVETTDPQREQCSGQNINGHKGREAKDIGV